MQNSNLLSICHRLTKEDWQMVIDFSESPAHNVRKEVTQLLGYIRHYIGKIKGSHLEKEKVWKQLYQRPFEDATLRNLMHLAQQLIQETLAYQHWKKEQNEVELHLLAAMRERKINEKIISSELKNTSQQHDNQLLRNQTHFHQQFRLASERYENAIAQKRNTAEGFDELSAALNVYFVAQKLREACTVLSHRTFFKQEMTVDFLPEVLEYVAKNEAMRAIPVVALYYHSYHSLSDLNDEWHFEQLKKILFASSHLFKVAELREYYLHTINCCIRRINLKKSEYTSEVFEIYRKGLETNALLDNGQLSRFTYNNIVMAGVLLKNFDWTEQFIHDYKPFLEEKYRESTFQHSLCTFYFKKKDYEKAMKLLQTVEFDDILHNLDARRMMLCMYYDLDEFDALDTHLEAFKTYIYRQKGLDYHRENCLNLVNFTKRLLNLDFSNEKKINELRMGIIETVRLVEKDWLLEKLG